MNAHRLVGLGLALLVGCASHATTRPAITSTQKQVITPVATEPVADQSKWQASVGSPTPEILNDKARAFAKALQTPDVHASATQPVRDAFTDNPPIVNPAPVSAPTANVNAGAMLPQQDSLQAAQAQAIRQSAHPTSDDPQIVPEYKDFQTPGLAGNDPLAERLRKRSEKNPKGIADQLDMLLYGMLSEYPAPDLAAYSSLPDDDRELVAALLDGLSNFRSTVREGGNMLWGRKIKPLLDMADRLRSQADLTVSSVALCRRVDGYGKYDPILPARFNAGRENPAIVYCEVENFLPVQNNQQLWETHLSEQVTLFTDQGMMVWSDTTRDVTDECRNRRHDFFAYNIIKLPANLSIGRYMLKVSIEDKNAKHVAEATVPLSIVAQ